MYFKEDKQISLFEFGQAEGLKLDPENRWIKKSEIIDWDKIEKKYAYLFCDNNGADKILFGTDSPWEGQTWELESIKNVGLDEECLDKILYKNAKELLDL